MALPSLFGGEIGIQEGVGDGQKLTDGRTRLVPGLPLPSSRASPNSSTHSRVSALPWVLPAPAHHCPSRCPPLPASFVYIPLPLCADTPPSSPVLGSRSFIRIGRYLHSSGSLPWPQLPSRIDCLCLDCWNPAGTASLWFLAVGIMIL